MMRNWKNLGRWPTAALAAGVVLCAARAAAPAAGAPVATNPPPAVVPAAATSPAAPVVTPATPPTGNAPIVPPAGPVTPPGEGAPSLEAILLKARSFRGAEDKVAGIQTIRLEGAVFNGSGERIGGLVQVLKKPGSQRAETIREGRTNVSATDGFEAWLLVEHQDGRKSLTYITEPLLERFINSGFELLFPYRGPTLRRNGTTTLDGAAEFLGVQCWKVTFSYPQGLSVSCYFDLATGELRGKTLAGEPSVYLEIGAISAGGVTLPVELHTYRDGRLVSFTRFSKLEINPRVDDALFVAPSLTSLLQSMPAPGTPAPAPAAATSSSSSPAPSSAPVLPGGATLSVPPLAPRPEEQPQLFVPPPSAP